MPNKLLAVSVSVSDIHINVQTTINGWLWWSKLIKLDQSQASSGVTWSIFFLCFLKQVHGCLFMMDMGYNDILRSASHTESINMCIAFELLLTEGIWFLTLRILKHLNCLHELCVTSTAVASDCVGKLTTTVTTFLLDGMHLSLSSLPHITWLLRRNEHRFS